jgi:hypothetical protein
LPQLPPTPKSQAGLALGILGGVLALVAVFWVLASGQTGAQRAQAGDRAAQADARYLAGEISMFWADNPPGSSMRIEEGPDTYTLIGSPPTGSGGDWEVTLPKDRGNALQPSSYYEAQDSWCVGVHNDGGKVKDFTITALDGMSAGATC